MNRLKLSTIRDLSERVINKFYPLLHKYRKPMSKDQLCRFVPHVQWIGYWQKNKKLHQIDPL